MGPFSSLLSIVPFLFSSSVPDITSTKQITQESKKTFDKLNDPGTFSYSSSPTIKFSFVPSPNSSESSSISSATLENKSIFYKVRESYITESSSEKTLALLLPGLDGVGVSSFTQYDSLSSNFELWRMAIDPTSDRTSFSDLVTIIVDFLDKATNRDGEGGKNCERDVLLIGESFGGLLAPNVALRILNRSQRNKRIRQSHGNEAINDALNLKGLVMINPATSYDRTQWSTFAPALASLRHLETQSAEEEKSSNTFPTPYSVLGGLALALTVPDSTQFQQIADIIISEYTGRVPDAEMLNEGLTSMKEGFDVLAQNLPAATLEHRITRWMPVGTSIINSNLAKLDVPSIVVAGSEDNMLPSESEAKRLVNEMPNCERIEIAGSGHFVLDNRVNLTDIVLNSHIFPKEIEQKKKDPILDWEPPTPEVVREVLEERVKPLRRLTSPVFFSTDKFGNRKKGLSHLPGNDEGPLLFVANHQLFGSDLNLIISQLIEDRDLWVRGLAHPVIFNAVNQLEGGNNSDNGSQSGGRNQRDASFRAGNGPDGRNSQQGLFQQFGAVMVTPRNFYRLMETNQNALLFPGGVREVFHGKGEEYQLFWPEKVDFVRIAAKFNATIVPLSALGAAESTNILIDAPDMVKLPFGIGDRVANFSAAVSAGRFDADNNDELFTPPFALPKATPARFYFMFGRPMSTGNIDHKNRKDCEELYKDVKTEMMRGFDDVLSARENDPYKDSWKRIVTEQISGKPAPTFGMEEFHGSKS